MKKTKIILLCALFILVIGVVSPIIWYNSNISPVSNSTEKKEIEVPIGSSVDSIGTILKDNNIIRSKLAFKLYVKINKVDDFQAGTYNLSENMSLENIIESLKSGIVFSNETVTVTFIEGKSMKRFAKSVCEATNNTEEQIFELLKDEKYIDSLIDKYWFITDEIKQAGIYYPLEGYLFPDTYSFDSKDVSVQKIFEVMLNKMGDVLSKYKSEIENSKYTVHEILTMASLCELEAVHAEDRAEVAGVFYNRLKNGDSLGSDVTTYYAIGVELGERDLYQSELDAYNPYNTRGPKMNGRLPIGPISNVAESSIKAAIYPNVTDNLFFVADKNGKLYFAKTNSEHVSITNKLISSGMWIEFD